MVIRKITSNIIGLASACLLVLMAASCDTSRVYEENVDIQAGKWYADSALVFKVNIEDTASTYNIYYNIRNSLNYGYYNLYVTYYLEDTNGNTIDQQLQDITLMNPKTGEPYGSGLGDLFEHQLIAMPNYKFRKQGVYKIKMKQYMRQSPIEGILSFGLRIEKSTQP